MPLVVVPASDALAGRARGRPRNGAVVWYLGECYEHWLDLRSGFAADARWADAGAALTGLVAELAPVLQNLGPWLVTALDDPAWLGSDVGERSPYNSTLMTNAARFRLAEQLAAGAEEHWLVVDDPDVALALLGAHDQARWAGHRAPWRLRVARAWDHGCQVVRARLGGMARQLRRLGQLRRLRAGRPVPGALAGVDVLLALWARPDFGREPVRRDAYLGALPGLLRDGGCHVGVLASPLDWLAPFPQVADSVLRAADPSLLLDDCLTPWDVLREGVRRGPRFRLAQAPRWLAAALTLEARREAASWRPCSARLYGRVGAVLARRGIHPRVVIHPYEGQSWERCLTHGLRVALPQVRVIGLQHIPFAESSLNFLRRTDLPDWCLPDRLWVSGVAFERLYQAAGWPARRLAVAGALRFDSLPEAANAQAGAEVTLVCATSIEYEESLELAHCAAEARRLAGGLQPLVVVFHPVTSASFRERLKARLEALGHDGLTYAADGLSQWLRRPSILLYNSSAAVFDALAMGRPAIFMGSSLRIDYDKAPENLVHRCRGPQALADQLARGLAAPSGQDALVPYLAPVDSAAILHSLGEPS